ncbi:hypothetical protein V5799_006767 [Amblyomma americanum]|uniref:Secreted protein n=1 Tax=Amblyomma americanum TaxID=6943 RepID=A0AAQ4DVG2_AMBAM
MNHLGIMVLLWILLARIYPLQGWPSNCWGSCKRPTCVVRSGQAQNFDTTRYFPKNGRCTKIIFKGVCRGTFYKSEGECNRCCPSSLNQ